MAILPKTSTAFENLVPERLRFQCLAAAENGGMSGCEHSLPTLLRGISRFDQRFHHYSTCSPTRSGNDISNTTQPVSVLNGPWTSPGGRLA